METLPAHPENPVNVRVARRRRPRLAPLRVRRPTAPRRPGRRPVHVKGCHRRLGLDDSKESFPRARGGVGGDRGHFPRLGSQIPALGLAPRPGVALALSSARRGPVSTVVWCQVAPTAFSRSASPSNLTRHKFGFSLHFLARRVCSRRLRSVSSATALCWSVLVGTVSEIPGGAGASPGLSGEVLGGWMSDRPHLAVFQGEGYQIRRLPPPPPTKFPSPGRCRPGRQDVQ